MGDSNKKINNFYKCILCAIAFFIVTMPFRKFFSLMSTTEVRPASALPPVCGLIFGPWGAVGCAIGNFAADIACGYDIRISIVSFFIQIIYGYLPYVLWYGMRKDSKYASYPVFNSVSNVLRFVIIIFINSFICAVMLGLCIEFFDGEKLFSNMALIIFFNNFDFSILFGMPLVTLASVSHISIVIPKASKRINKNAAIYNIAIILFFVISALTIIKEMTAVKFSLINYAIVLVLLLAIIVMYPIKKVNFQDDYKSHKLSLNEKMITRFMITGVILSIVIAIMGYIVLSSNNVSWVTMWNRIYIYMAIILNMFFCGVILFLRYIEKDITNPLKSIADIAANYVMQKKETHNSKDALSECNEFEKDKTEIGVMARSMKKMISDLDIYMDNIKRNTKEKERISAELNIATQIQKGLLPK